MAANRVANARPKLVQGLGLSEDRVPERPGLVASLRGLGDGEDDLAASHAGSVALGAGGASSTATELIELGLAESGEPNVRETDGGGNTVRVHELERDARGASSPAAR